MLIHCRQATNEDTPYLKDIARRVITANYVPFLGLDATTAFIGSGMSDKEIDGGLEHCAVMINGDQAIGFAITNENLLHLIMIDVPFQNKGYGSKLLAHTTEKLFRYFDHIKLQTFKENVPAVQFYLKNDWIISNEEKVPEIDKMMLHFEKFKTFDML